MLSDPDGRSRAGHQPIPVLARVDARGWSKARPIPWPGSAHRVGEASDGPPVVEAAIHHCGGTASLVPAPSNGHCPAAVSEPPMGLEHETQAGRVDEGARRETSVAVLSLQSITGLLRGAYGQEAHKPASVRGSAGSSDRRL